MLKEKIKNLPRSSGIYLFKDKDNNIIYVGKAKSLKSRVSSYFKNTPSSDSKTSLLVTEIANIDFIETKNEEEALLLEAQLVKEKQPKFNITLKAGQPFIFFLFTPSIDSNGQKVMPSLKLVRNRQLKGTYFGPFSQKQAVRGVYQFLMRTFRLTVCNQKIPSGCLNFHLNLCSGTCLDKFNMDDYIFRIEIIKKILSGNDKDLHIDLKNQIETLSKNFEFERARQLHEILQKLEHVIEVIKTHFNENKYAQQVALTSSSMSQQTAQPTIIGLKLKAFLNLEIEPKTIDCFDISHFQSQSIVGSCIRFTNGVPEKSKFRRFKIKTLHEQNDYAALQEIVARRYRNPDDLPDIILIDGGKGQLNAVKNLFPQVTFISLAKREETLYSPEHKDGIKLDVHTEVGKLLIALRDYAHHFAINYHRLKNRKSYQ